MPGNLNISFLFYILTAANSKVAGCAFDENLDMICSLKGLSHGNKAVVYRLAAWLITFQLRYEQELKILLGRVCTKKAGICTLC